MSKSPVSIGIIGAGRICAAHATSATSLEETRLTAIADVDTTRVHDACEKWGGTPHVGYESLLEDPAVEAVIIGLPHFLHRDVTIQALQAGKHVLLEKPMATSVADAMRINEAAAAARRVLLVGHAHSYDAPIARMREIVETGELGAPFMANTWGFTDWVYRPRRPEELDVAKGGGVTFRQGAHQFDILRLLCGGLARSVRAKTFDLDPGRSTVGAHVAFVDFADGPAATAVYSGYDHLPGALLTSGIGEWGFPQAPKAAKAVASSAADELRTKAERAKHAIPAKAPHPPTFGLTILSCERGDIRQVPEGLAVHTRDGTTTIPIAIDRSPRELLLDELHAAIAGIRAPVHDGAWALASLELCLGAMESARLGREVPLGRQVAVRRG